MKISSMKESITSPGKVSDSIYKVREFKSSTILSISGTGTSKDFSIKDLILNIISMKKELKKT